MTSPSFNMTIDARLIWTVLVGLVAVVAFAVSAADKAGDAETVNTIQDTQIRINTERVIRMSEKLDSVQRSITRIEKAQEASNKYQHQQLDRIFEKLK